MPLLTRNQLLLAKVESTKGLDAAPTAALNAILADLVDVSFDIQKIQAPEVRRSISEAPERPGRKKASFTIRVALKGSGEAGVAPEIAPLLQCCALKQTIVSDVGLEEVNYKPVSTEADMKTATVHLFYDGRAVKAVGCTGNFSISAPPGEIAIATFNLQGSLSFNGDEAMPSGESYQDVTAAVVESGNFSFGSQSPLRFSQPASMWNALRPKAASFSAAASRLSSIICSLMPVEYLEYQVSQKVGTGRLREETSFSAAEARAKTSSAPRGASQEPIIKKASDSKAE